MLTGLCRNMWLRLRGLRARPEGIARCDNAFDRWEPDISRWMQRMVETGAVQSFPEIAWFMFADTTPSASKAISREAEKDNDLQQLFLDCVTYAMGIGYLIASERISRDDASSGIAAKAKELFVTVRQCARAEGRKPGCGELDIFNGLTAVSALPAGLADLGRWLPSLERSQ